jgi:hypothetical protein
MDIAFGAVQELGAVSGWNEQTPDRGTNSERKFTLNKDGNESDSHVHAAKIEVNVPYVANTDGTVAIPGTLGATLNSLILTQIQINTSADDYAKMSLQAHNHAGINDHVACKTGTHAIPNIDGFGATDFLGGTAGTDAAVESSSLTIKCEHVDINGDSGTHVDGENYHGVIEAETIWHGVPSVEAAASWDQVTSQTKTNNQGHKTTTVKGSKALALA